MSQPGPRSMHILVADDDSVIRTVVCGVLQHQGHTTAAAATTDEARLLLEEQVFDAAIIDSGLPGDGAALRRELEGGSMIGRTIQLTADLTGREGARPERVLAKPIDYGVLIRLLAAIPG